MHKVILGGATVVISVLVIVLPVPDRSHADGLSYDPRCNIAMIQHGASKVSEQLRSRGKAPERATEEDVKRLWPLAREWVVAHHQGPRIKNIGLRYLEVSPQSDVATVFVSVNTSSGSYVYVLRYEWRNGWTVTQWCIAPQDKEGLNNANRLP